MNCYKCGDKPKKNCGAFPKAVIEIDNPEQITLMRKVVIPASMGDDTTVPPTIGKYHNVLLNYEANNKSYLYSSDGIPTLLNNGVTDYEAATNLPQINGNTLIGNKTGEELGLQNEISVVSSTGLELNDDELRGVPATEDTMGMVIAGSGLNVSQDGLLNVDIGNSLRNGSSGVINTIHQIYGTMGELRNSTSLTEGDYAETLGYYNPNDGGGSLFYIREREEIDVDDGGSIIFVGDLTAEMLDDNGVVNVRQFGAHGDGVTDDSDSIRAAVAYKKNASTTVIFDESVYIAQGTIYIYSNTTIDLNGGTIKNHPNTPSSAGRNGVQFMNNIESVKIAGYGALSNFNVKDGVLDGTPAGFAFNLLHAENCSFENILFKNCFVATHVFDLGGCKNIRIENCDFIGNLHVDSDTAYREVIQTDYATFGGLPYWGDDPEFAFDALPTEGLLVKNCIFKKNDNDTYYLNAIGTHSRSEGVIKDVVIEGCQFYGCEYSNIRLPRVENVFIHDNSFYSMRDDRPADNFAINLNTSSWGSSLSDFAPKNVTIEGNKYFCSVLEDDQIFIGLANTSEDYVSKVRVINNNYWSSYSTGMGQDFLQLGTAEDCVVESNYISKAKRLLFKSKDRVIRNLTLANNRLDDCKGLIISHEDDTEGDIPTLAMSGNIWSDADGATDINSCIIRKGVSANQSVTASASNYTTVVFDSDIAGTLFKSNAAGNITIPDFIFNMKAYGYIYLTADGDTDLEVRIRVRDTITQTNPITCSRHYDIKAGNATVDIPTAVFSKQNISTTPYLYNPSSQRYIFYVQVKSANANITIKNVSGGWPAGTSLFIEGY